MNSDQSTKSVSCLARNQGKTCNTITGNARNAETRSLKLVSLLQPAEGRPSSSIFKTRSSLPLPARSASTQKSTKPTQVPLVTFWISSGTKGLRVASTLCVDRIRSDHVHFSSQPKFQKSWSVIQVNKPTFDYLLFEILYPRLAPSTLCRVDVDFVTLREYR